MFAWRFSPYRNSQSSEGSVVKLLIIFVSIAATISGQIVKNHENLNNSEMGRNSQKSMLTENSDLKSAHRMAVYFRFTVQPDGDFRFQQKHHRKAL
jgi:hypothetical protein